MYTRISNLIFFCVFEGYYNIQNLLLPIQKLNITYST